jgi:hypothetical protein
MSRKTIITKEELTIISSSNFYRHTSNTKTASETAIKANRSRNFVSQSPPERYKAYISEEESELEKN